MRERSCTHERAGPKGRTEPGRGGMATEEKSPPQGEAAISAEALKKAEQYIEVTEVNLLEL